MTKSDNLVWVTNAQGGPNSAEEAKIRRTLVVGPAKATAKFSQEYFFRHGWIGLYKKAKQEPKP